MFKYNELSDLLDGSLVTPISATENGSILCLDKDGNECYYEFDDFDFDKLPEERVEPEVEPEVELEVELEVEPEVDDSNYDGSEEINENPKEEIIIEETKEDERFLTPLETKEFVENYGIALSKNEKIKVWRDII